MTPERISDLRQDYEDGQPLNHAEVVLECLDEITRLQAEVEALKGVKL